MEVKLVVAGGKQAGAEVPIRGPKFLIGRGTNCHLRPQNTLVSRNHCVISIDQDKVVIEDCGSTNGTVVNDEKIDRPRELKDGDRLKIGLLELDIRIAASPPKKMKPKVHNIQEAAARTVATSARSEDDMDISSWLEDEDEDSDEPPSATIVQPPTAHDTAVTNNFGDTITTTLETPDKQRKHDSSSKITGPFKAAKKPKAVDSRSAAEDILRQYFPRRKP